MNTTISKPKFKSEWTDKEMAKMKQAIKKAFLFKPIPTNQGTKVFYTYADLDNFAGLAYTSSSSYAGLWVCNGMELRNAKYPGFVYVGFAMGEDGAAYGVMWDQDEEEIIVPLK
jgi:hypothetical protein